VMIGSRIFCGKGSLLTFPTVPHHTFDSESIVRVANITSKGKTK
jgi:hypothetical protein